MVEDAKVTEQPLTEEELSKLKDLQQQKQAITNELGNIEMQERFLNLRKDEIEMAFDNYIQSEQSFYDTLKEKYKSGTVNLDRGVFVPSP